MHVLGKPVERHLAPDASSFRSRIDLCAHRGELSAQPDIINEARDLLFAFASLGSAAQKIRQGWQRLPINTSRRRVVTKLEILALKLCQFRRRAVVLR